MTVRESASYFKEENEAGFTFNYYFRCSTSELV